MADSTRSSYDDLAQSYHLIFQDWPQSILRQASILGPIIEHEIDSGPLRILDCACGVGTQTLGLAQRGHALAGVDLSEAAIQRARREAEQRGLLIEFEVADMRDLSSIAYTDFDVALVADNALPHLLSDEDLVRAVQQIAERIRADGLFMATIRDYDQIVQQHPSAPSPAIFQEGGYRRIYHQVWDWTDARQYTAHVYITQESEKGWTCAHFVTIYRAMLRDELTAALRQVGFVKVRWLMPAESGFYQPLVLARRPSAPIIT